MEQYILGNTIYFKGEIKYGSRDDNYEYYKL